jgi:pimeloyl-ACP methyl ester carboxylesterase
MPFARLHDSTEIHHRVVGDRGPWVAAVSSARFSLEDMMPLARELAALGHRVLVHDRRNCGQSSLSFDFAGSEDEIWAADLAELLTLLGVDDAVVVGLSRGARIAARFAIQHPGLARGLVLWGLSGGSATRAHLDDYYFGRYLRACAEGGMDAVCQVDHFAGVAGARPENPALLRALAPERFGEVMTRWRESYHVGDDDEILGLTDGDLASISVPTAVVPYYDRGHPMSTARRAVEGIPGALLLDFDPSRHADLTRSVDDTATVARLIAEFDRDLAVISGSSSAR